MRVLIAGGGIAGLATALTLHRKGIPFELYERTFDALNASMGIVLDQKSLHPLTLLGINLSSLGFGQPLKRFVLHTANGQVKHIQHLADGTIGIKRRDLISALLRALPPANIHFEHAITAYNKNESGFCSAELSNGRKVFADVFVAADGVRSKARNLLDERWQNNDARVCELVGMVQDKSIRAALGSEFHQFQHCSGGIAFCLLPVDSHHVMWTMQFDCTRFGLPSDIPLEKHLFVSNLVGKWAKPLPRVIAATNFNAVPIWRPINVDPLTQFFVDNLAYVGDAAHPLLPFTRQGVASALADSVCLAEDLWACRAHQLPVQEGLYSYSKVRRQAILPYILQGRQQTDKFLMAQNFQEYALLIAH